MKLPEWSPQLSLDFMTRNSIGTAILSLSAPAMSFIREQDKAVSLCREINEYAAALRDQNPTKFGFFATLPGLGDVKACVQEIGFAFDTLKASGVTLLTSYGDRYLGHPDFRPIWAELDRRAAVVFIHPALESMTGGLMNPWMPRPIIDFPHETTRTAVHLVISNTVRDFSNCKIILSHGGGTLPFIATRVAHQSADVGYIEKSAEEFLEDAQRFYFDLALTAYDDPLELLLNFAKPDHILYGSDYPFAREQTIARQVAFLDQKALPGEAEPSITRGAALKLFPKFRTQADGEINGE